MDLKSYNQESVLKAFFQAVTCQVCYVEIFNLSRTNKERSTLRDWSWNSRLNLFNLSLCFTKVSRSSSKLSISWPRRLAIFFQFSKSASLVHETISVHPFFFSFFFFSNIWHGRSIHVWILFSFRFCFSQQKPSSPQIFGHFSFYQISSNEPAKLKPNAHVPHFNSFYRQISPNIPILWDPVCVY